MTGPPRPGPADPGLQAERTSLAWRRSLVSTSATLTLVLVSASRAGQRWVVIATGAVAGVLAAGAYRHWRRPARRAGVVWPPLLVAGGSVVLLAGLGVAAAVTDLLARR